jgi:DNA-directed RNA polymerase subunit E'/Rpb7
MSQQDNMALFTNALITKKIHVNIQNIGSNIKQTLEKMIAADIEGKCIVEGFVKNRSTKIMTYSSGLVQGSSVTFEVVYECSICSPVEGMIIHCIAKNITKAGIRAETNDSPSPVVIFVARDHHYTTPYFSEVKENEDIVVKVIGQRYELNDKYISIIAELIPKQLQVQVKVKAKPVQSKTNPVQAKQVQAKANPVKAQIKESEQVQTKPVQTKPVQAQPTKVVTQPASVKPAQTKRKPRLILED